MLDRCAPAKPVKGSRHREKARGKRQEAKHAKSVRQQCVERDGYCLIWMRTVGVIDVLGRCGGRSEWAHIGTHRRYRTRGQAAELRHKTEWSGMLCKRHHDAYDAHEFDIEPQTAAGMDGAFAVVRRAA